MATVAAPFQAVAYWLPKDGSEEYEWEDSLAFNEARGLFAVADGVANSYRSGDWARHLTADFVTRFPPDGTIGGQFRPWLNQRVEAWWAQQPEAENWWEQDADADGAAATLLGLRLSRAGGRTWWESVSIGDCCLFRVPPSGTVHDLVVPVAFDHRPQVVSNLRERVDGLLREPLQLDQGDASPGDHFVLTSDALGEAFIRYGAGMSWRSLARMGQAAFREMVVELRRNGAIVNDDASLLVVAVP